MLGSGVQDPSRTQPVIVETENQASYQLVSATAKGEQGSRLGSHVSKKPGGSSEDGVELALMVPNMLG